MYFNFENAFSVSTLTMSGNTFNYNYALERGGAIMFHSLHTSNLVTQTFSTNTFFNNTANISGGAYHYDSRRFDLITTSTFTNNSAPYGSNVSSYPIMFGLTTNYT
jgi:hypothetical protein